MELPPKQADLVVTITGKMFKWDYEYKRQFDAKGETIKIGQDVAGFQEPLILIKDKTVSLNITSNDVNHAWWIPAFGVKKDAINGRFNSTWFTPLKFGFFKGQCAELCGPDHGTMIITAVVVDQTEFDRYIELQRHRADTDKIFRAVEPAPGTAFSDEALRTAVAGYFGKDKSASRVFALKYWIASNYASLEHYPPIGTTQAQVTATIPGKRAQVDNAIAAVVADRGGRQESSIPAVDGGRARHDAERSRMPFEASDASRFATTANLEDQFPRHVSQEGASADSERQKALVSNIAQEGQK
jgi:hypothetical protein